MNRKVAPLVPARDAVVVDTTDFNASQVFEKVMSFIQDAIVAGKLPKGCLQK